MRRVTYYKDSCFGGWGFRVTGVNPYGFVISQSTWGFRTKKAAMRDYARQRALNLW